MDILIKSFCVVFGILVFVCFVFFVSLFIFIFIAEIQHNKTHPRIEPEDIVFENHVGVKSIDFRFPDDKATFINANSIEIISETEDHFGGMFPPKYSMTFRFIE